LVKLLLDSFYQNDQWTRALLAIYLIDTGVASIDGNVMNSGEVLQMIVGDWEG
jgi:hypothetical protein